MSVASSLATMPGSEADGTSRVTTLARMTNRHVVLAGSLILLLPNVLFALQLSLVPCLSMLMGACTMIAVLSRRSDAMPNATLDQPIDWPRAAISMVLATALLVFGGEGHLMFANWDWLWRDSVLADLARTPFPPMYKVGDTSFFLRAPLGMYMLPAMAAKVTSLAAGHAALLFQNALLLSLVLYTLATIAKPRAALVVLVFLGFSGLDVVGELLMWLLDGQSLSTFVLPSHIENWTGLQYSSVITQLFWVPNHALPSYWMALLVLLCAKGELAIDKLIVAMASSLFWSPFAFVGTLPLAAYLFAKDARVNIARPVFWLAGIAAISFLPVALYMTIDAAKVPHQFILFQPFAIVLIALFLAIEIPHLVIIREAWPQSDPTYRGVLIVSIVFLVVLPTMRVGASNDLVSRASIPSLLLVAFAFAHALDSLWSTRRFAIFGVGMAIAFIGAVTPALEIVRSLTFSPFAISDCNIVTVWQAIWAKHPTLENYLARESQLPPWLIESARPERLRDERDAACWKGIPYPPQANISAISNAMLLDMGNKAKKYAP